MATHYLSDNRDSRLKDALDHNKTLVKASPDAPKVASCPACDSTVDRRGGCTDRKPADKTWYYRHRRGESCDCPRGSQGR